MGPWLPPESASIQPRLRSVTLRPPLHRSTVVLTFSVAALMPQINIY